MKTVLIVEDEKMIRQGIRTMVQRSGVPVEIIMECNNGEAALEIVKEQQIDVMFTDIRMPKMDGIQLVQEIAKLENKPYIVAISGYDDFSYAVEMLRNGVKEYILKPVEREKITDILEKLEQELKEKQQKKMADIKIGQKQIKYLISGEGLKDEEINLLEAKFNEHFFQNGYVECVSGKGFSVKERSQILFIDELPDCNIAILETETLPLLMKNELHHECAGISMIHHGIRELRVGFEEAFEARKRAFYLGAKSVSYDEPKASIAEGLKLQLHKLVEEQAWTSRLHLIGTEKTDELGSQWETLFEELRKERIEVEEFEQGMQHFLDELSKIYRNAIDDAGCNQIENCRNIYAFSNMDEYQEFFMELVMGLHNHINSEQDNSGNQQKIKMAVEYIQKNYNKDLNMAVVSNYISMNYSLFSYAFKQYTGSNFVNYLKDIRMAKAKKLLAETDFKVIEISQAIGYDNEKHFMKTFKASCGVSPSEYRKNMRNGD